MGARSCTSRPVAVDLFCGAGGMSLGFEQAGFDVLAAIDSDPVALAVHKRNFPHAYPVCGDVSNLGREVIHAAIRKGWATAGRDGEWDGSIDCLFGGPSCQGFLDIGKQRPDDHRNDLVFAFARLVDELRPRTFVIENVRGLLFEKVRPTLDRLLKHLSSAGYVLSDAGPMLLDAAEFGVPQRRRRVFIVGRQAGLADIKRPAPYAGPTVEGALDDLPDVDRYEELLTQGSLQLGVAEIATMVSSASAYARSLRTPRAYEYERLWDERTLTGCQRTRHSDAVRVRFAALKPGESDAVSRTSRLSGPGHANTLRAGTGPDHGSYTAPRPIHHERPRVVTVREAARLHSFPDWFSFHRTKWHALREIGNSVPPSLAYAVAATVVDVVVDGPLEPPTKRVDLGPDSLLNMTFTTAADHFDLDRALLPKDVRRESSGPQA